MSRRKPKKSWAATGGSTYRWRKLREQVFARDGRVCRVCGTTQNLEVDHIVPKVNGGRDELVNLQVLCGPHNRSKGDGLNTPLVYNHGVSPTKGRDKTRDIEENEVGGLSTTEVEGTD